MSTDEYVSTGSLPSPAQVRLSLDEAYRRFRDEGGGEPSHVYPALARVPAHLFGLCAAGTRGGVHPVGDADHGFTVMSVAKPFVFALVCQELGAEALRQRLGVNATGLPFNSLAAVERGPDGRTNPMVNPGAIATASLAPGATAAARWKFLHDGLSRFAGHDLPLDDDVFASAAATNHRNRALADLLATYRILGCDPMEAVDAYTRQSCLRVTTVQLATMGATLANGGVHPTTGERVVDREICHFTLAVMATAGLYETSGDWLYDVGVPGKSGIGGGIVVVSPGKGALATFAPPLDTFGNSVKGQLAARFLSRRLGLTLFASEPDASGAPAA
ncbi:glutaminase 2 [Actinoplanes ianthinogenes]|uniref:Glutaminase n=1 Tax=Actinoplanes ianthinogenes TaxID=122358 RepID=A0ABM7LKX5_9ACTN|nr:glutaminase A [Actinoplanes ianthinogenes]BCJ39813.1 glutaminase 2 [Actinoplanes ianthinogenes]GGR08313.1 glutaminase 2 [Actinoplanes ianthinogenes]